MMFEGPEDELVLTENAQPALMAVSLAVVRVIEKDGNSPIAESCAFVAGHSLGECSALAAAGTFSVTDTAVLLKQRGQAMQAAVPVGEGAMAALLGVNLATARVIAEEAAEADVCSAANDNAPGQVVLSGAKAAIDRVADIAAKHGARRCVLLPVSAPFHCALMAPAADAVAQALAQVKMLPPQVPLVPNVFAEACASVDDIRRYLVEQVTGMVRWRESVLFMKEQGVDTLVEIGVGKVLGGLAKRIDQDLKGLSVGTPADIEAFLANI
jgi:[acyl-carrier-protein] S-malonyltransferase